MNERIRELSQVADRLADDELAHLERVHNRLYSFTEGREILMEKFAELIVRECIEAMRLVPYESDREFGDEVIYQEAVKKHFGVES
jgi:hypothetical protein